jgi:signal transduction histidine kinase
MSHELRTPMNAIMGMTDLLLLRQHSRTKQLQRAAIGKVDQHRCTCSSRHQRHPRHVERSKPTAYACRIRFKPCEVFENIQSLIGHKAQEKGLKLLIDLSPKVAEQSLLGDPLRLGQILLNFSGNGIKFTDQGSVTLRCRCIEDTPNDMLLRWEVCDTGIGIDAATQARLFNAFEQADNSMTRKYGGTGLGLAISKRLVHLMGGDIGVDSEPRRAAAPSGSPPPGQDR